MRPVGKRSGRWTRGRHLVKDQVPGVQRERISEGVHSVLQAWKCPSSSLQCRGADLSGGWFRWMPCRQVHLVSPRRLRRQVAERRRKEGHTGWEDPCAGRSRGRCRRGSQTWGYDHVGRSPRTLEESSGEACHLRWRHGAFVFTTGRWRPGDTPGWNWAAGQRIYVRAARYYEQGEDETGTDCDRLGSGRGSEEQEEPEHRNRGGETGSCSHSTQREERQEGKEEKPKPVQQKEKEIQQEKAEEVKFQQGLQSEPLWQPKFFERQLGTALEEEGPEEPWVGLQTIGGPGHRAASSRGDLGGGLHDRFPAAENVHLLPAGPAAALGCEEPRLPGDQLAGQVPGHAERGQTCQPGRRAGSAVASCRDSNSARLGDGQAPRGVRSRRRGIRPPAPAAGSAKAPAAGGKGWRERLLAQRGQLGMGGKLVRAQAQRQRKRWKRERKERKGEKQGQRGPRTQGRRRCQSRRRRELDYGGAKRCKTLGEAGDTRASKEDFAGSPQFEEGGKIEAGGSTKGQPLGDLNSGPSCSKEDDGPTAAEDECNETIEALVNASLATCAELMGQAAEELSGGVVPAAGLADTAVGVTPSDWLGQLTNCKDLSEVGIALAWGHNAGFLSLKEDRARPPRPAKAQTRLRGLFPLPVAVPLSVSSLDCPSFLDRTSSVFPSAARESWLAVVSAALNSFYGCDFSPSADRVGKVHRAVRENLLSRIDRFLRGDQLFGFSFNEVAAEVREKRLGYCGEEISQPHPLTVSQIIHSLPPQGHGASVPLLPFLVGHTKHLLANPLDSLVEESLRGGSPCQAKVHIRGGEALSVFRLLCERGVTQWVPANAAFSDRRGTYLNGLFGVEKPGKLTGSGEPILRVIMNFIPINGIFEVIKGDISYLPSPTSWIPICADKGEVFSMSQGDMQSAFYLFAMPPGWEQFFCFNYKVSGKLIGLDPNTEYRPSCKVLPMGWSSSVGIMQQVSRQVLLMRGLPRDLELQRIGGIPRWFTDSVREANPVRAWWQVYLDNFMSGESSRTALPGQGLKFQLEAMDAWAAAGILTAKDKQVLGEKEVIELGVRFDGVQGLLGASPARVMKTILATLHILRNGRWSKRETQVVLGRWIFILQFRRAAMGCLSRAWECLESWQPSRRQLETLHRELSLLMCLCPILQTDLTMEYDGEVTCSDASEGGGAVARSDGLTWSGSSYIAQQLQRDLDPIPCPILVVSCFNGIGGSFRAYDVLGVRVMGKISIDVCSEANRVTKTTWPDVEVYLDINSITREDVFRWANDFNRAEEVHIWGGFPCVHLSSVRAFRQNLEGAGSNLFWKLLELIQWVQDIFGSFCKVKFCIENVASMDEAARREISSHLEVMPIKLDPADCMPFSRPRLAWCSEELFEMEGLQLWTESDYVRAFVSGPAIASQQWIRPGWYWPAEGTGEKFPTFMKAIKRRQPPPVPAGLRRATPDMIERWRQDSYRFPPYQYAEKFLLFHPVQPPRLLDASERELLPWFGAGHTTSCMSASKMKKSFENYEDIRKTLCGDSFAMLSFSIVGAVLCSEMVPRMSPATILNRLGLAPGASAHPKVAVPISRWLSYGGDSSLPTSSEQLVKQLGSTVNHTGADVRVSTGLVLGKKTQSHCSVRALWWQWKHLFKTKWLHHSHINLLEMKMILQTILWKSRRASAVNKRWLHLEDSMVCLFILSKGRTSSHLLQNTCNKIGAVQLAMGSQLLHAHVGSAENPTDAASRL